MEDEFHVGRLYVVAVAVHFEGIFQGYKTDDKGVKYAIFEQTSLDRTGTHSRRTVDVDNIVSAGPLNG